MIDSYGLTGIFYAIESRATEVSDHTHAYFVKDSDEIDTEMILEKMALIRKGLDLADMMIEKYSSEQTPKETDDNG